MEMDVVEEEEQALPPSPASPHSSRCFHPICQQLRESARLYGSESAFLEHAANPLGTVATSAASLVISSVLLLLNSSSRLVVVLSGSALILLITTITASIILQLALARARYAYVLFQYRLVRFHLDEVDSTLHQHDDEILAMVVKLSLQGRRHVTRIKLLYRYFLWYCLYVVLLLMFLLLMCALCAELAHRIEESSWP